MRGEEKADLKDKQIQCKICGLTFTFSIGEQEFFLDRGLAEPRRCPDCRRSQRKFSIAPEGGNHSG